MIPKHENYIDMPPVLVRKVEVTEGEVELSMEAEPRFNYAADLPESIEVTDQAAVVKFGDEKLKISSSVGGLKSDGRKITLDFRLVKDETAWFVLEYGDFGFNLSECDQTLERTTDYWKDWNVNCRDGACEVGNEWKEMAERSGLILKLLTNYRTGGMVAAATTSIPEKIGGDRNWDYRFSWIRDSGFTARALNSLGHRDETIKYFRWLKDICQNKDDPSKIRIMYTVEGAEVPHEYTLEHLEGYRGSKPVRVGNSATDQVQLDIYGEIVHCFYEAYRGRAEIDLNDWKFIEKILDYICEVWREKDYSLWEIRKAPAHYIHSKLMCWVGMDRGIRLARDEGISSTKLQKWANNRDQIKEFIIENGYSEQAGSFTQSAGSEHLDASLLLIPILGMLPPDDHRVVSTVKAIRENLSHNGMLYRYIADDGIEAGEETFVLCTFWMVDALVLIGELEEAQQLFNRVLSTCSSVGILAEEIDSERMTMLGNFPQAFSHVGLINSANILYQYKKYGSITV
jgi:GH15 family glucan-1,4-alpha-glucosidase